MSVYDTNERAHYLDKIADQRVSIAAKDAEIAALKEALEPYFRHWDRQAVNHSPLSSIWSTIHTPATYEQHVAARAALEMSGGVK